MTDAELDRRADAGAHAFDAAAVALGARQTTLHRPTAIAVHDDRHMARNGTGCFRY